MNKKLPVRCRKKIDSKFDEVGGDIKMGDKVKMKTQSPGRASDTKYAAKKPSLRLACYRCR
jgi:hypothetical protein